MRKILVVLTVLLMFSLNVYASSGGGNGESVPTLESSMPADGDIDVPLNQQITLVFSNNITNASVRDNNISSIKLVDDEGNTVDTEIVLADDQVEPDKKRDAVIIPANPLNPDTKYSVVISPELKSKNGVSAGVETTVSFTTQAENAAATTDVNTQDTTTQVNDTTSQETVIDTTGTTPETTGTETETKNNNMYTYIIIAGVIIVLALILIPTLKKKK